MLGNLRTLLFLDDRHWPTLKNNDATICYDDAFGGAIGLLDFSTLVFKIQNAWTVLAYSLSCHILHSGTIHKSVDIQIA